MMIGRRDSVLSVLHAEMEKLLSSHTQGKTHLKAHMHNTFSTLWACVSLHKFQLSCVIQKELKERKYMY